MTFLKLFLIKKIIITDCIIPKVVINLYENLAKY